MENLIMTDITDNSENTTGYIAKNNRNEGEYIITDLDDQYIGKIIFKTNKYIVYDGLNMKLYSVSRSGRIIH